MGAIGWKPLTHDGMTGHRSTSNLSKKPPIYNSGTFGFVNVGQELSKVHAITDPNDRPHLEIDLKP